MVFAVILWTLVGLFWATVTFFHFWNKNEKRRATVKKFSVNLGDKVALKMYDGGLAVGNWIRARFHLPLAPTRSERQYADTVSLLAQYGIRSAWRADAQGVPQLMIHNEDKPKLPAALEQMRADAEAGRPVPVS